MSGGRQWKVQPTLAAMTLACLDLLHGAMTAQAQAPTSTTAAAVIAATDAADQGPAAMAAATTTADQVPAATAEAANQGLAATDAADQVPTDAADLVPNAATNATDPIPTVATANDWPPDCPTTADCKQQPPALIVGWLTPPAGCRQQPQLLDTDSSSPTASLTSPHIRRALQAQCCVTSSRKKDSTVPSTGLCISDSGPRLPPSPYKSNRTD
ncbi:uncharacterized protein [Narcine bancroftii]|uniref:uncharacterized protein n=1 Tax=Narcine bancroftii TaxID=1343680 RepID=UPI0038322A6B